MKMKNKVHTKEDIIEMFESMPEYKGMPFIKDNNDGSSVLLAHADGVEMEVKYLNRYGDLCRHVVGLNQGYVFIVLEGHYVFIGDSFDVVNERLVSFMVLE